MDILTELEKVLDGNIYRRTNKKEVLEAFKRLDVNVSKIVEDFFLNFAGPFWEETLGIEFLDIVDDNVNIESITKECRGAFLFPKKYLVLSRMIANEVLVLNTMNDKVFRVDFEGGDKALLDEELEEEWESFEDFLAAYFNL